MCIDHTHLQTRIRQKSLSFLLKCAELIFEPLNKLKDSLLPVTQKFSLNVMVINHLLNLNFRSCNKSQVTRRLALFDRLQPDLQRGPSATLIRNTSPQQITFFKRKSLQT
jgi:hypothetical protein